MPTQLPSGRWRTRVRHPRTGRQLSARAVIGGPDTYATEDGAAAAEDEARRLLCQNARVGVTVEQYGDLPIGTIGDEHVAVWLKGGRNRGTAQQLRIFFNDAASAEAGRLVDRNPFAKLRLRSSRGRRDIQPPGRPRSPASSRSPTS
jgi:hypothetical protein